MLYLRDRAFPVTSAKITAMYTDAPYSRRLQLANAPCFTWSVEIETEEKVFDGERWSLALFHSDGFTLPIRSWKSLAGRTLTWAGEHNENGESAGTLILFGHEPVTAAKLSFSSIHGKDVHTTWTGTAHVHFDRQSFWEHVPFSYDGPARFAGITAVCDAISDAEQLLNELNRLVDTAEYVITNEEVRHVDTAYGDMCRWTLEPK